MTTGTDPLDDWGPQAPVHRGRSGGADAPSAHHASTGGADASQAPERSSAPSGTAAGLRRTRAYVVGAMVVGDLVVIAVGLFLFEPPTRWVVLAAGVLGFAAAAYMWNLYGRQIRGLEEDEAGIPRATPRDPNA
ncbi:hypothetical protein ACPYO6_09525 [Georgenia sp. Z1344]|uniref:hypothetical protein n=1 Tax=Georgenia sp. Z1344 TaxID=3416706 RepID=UPI003CF12A7B